MKYINYREERNHGTIDFPIEFYHVTPNHPRYEMSYHWHIEYELIRVLKGKLLMSIGESEFTASDADSDVAYIQDKGTVIVGITEFEPMDYKNENGDWIGFDADMARKVAEKLGVEAQFVIIDWDAKIMELDSKNIDVVWNGMTLTNEVLESMECTNAYCNNAQVVVVPAAK